MAVFRKPAPPTIGNAFARAVGMQAAGRRTSNATELASTVPGFQSREWPPWLLPALIALFGLALRLYRLDHESYWGDEVFAFALVKSSWAGMHAAMVKDVVHPPLHYYLLHEWFRWFGFGTLQGRLLSAVFGTLAIPALYGLANLLFDRETALVSALLLAVSQLSIQYSQEARAYAQLLLLTIAASYFFLRALKEQRSLFWWLFIASAVLVEYTHYFGLLTLISLAAFGVLYQRTYPIPRSWWVGGGLIVAAFLAAWLASGPLQEALDGPKMANERGKAWSERWFAPFELVNVFNNGRPNSLYSLGPWWTFVFGGLIFSVPAVIGLARAVAYRDEEKRSSRRDSAVFMLLLSALPLVIALAIGLVIRFYEYRYLSFCVAPYYVLIARGMTSFRIRAAAPLLACAALFYSGFALRANYLVPHKENFRDSTTYLAAHSQPGDCYVVVPSGEDYHFHMAWYVYASGMPR
ncbi:MAG TPA: glycosyltransferase family 39 protein [Bryobacteraceae bacterium]|nr:glycosyltransferase family 39 protein [Bryobacteraceae bacterium]